uniref:Putative ovule protein n=1 Tax=Solanum chacoense TaxID=4108 RepID=A0A0V0GZ33_SOLCH
MCIMQNHLSKSEKVTTNVNSFLLSKLSGSIRQFSFWRIWGVELGKVYLIYTDFVFRGTEFKHHNTI